MSSMQNALLLKDWSGKFFLEQIKVPTAGPGEILIKIQSAALNPAEWKIPRYKLLVDKFPVVLGSDIAGDVEAVGDGVDSFKVSDRVFCAAENWIDRGAFQQYVVTKADIVAKIPPSLSYDEAATLPLGIATAYSGLYADIPHGIGLIPPTSDEGYGRYVDTPIVVLGGASSVGQAVIQLAKLSGFCPIITTASARNAEALRNLGATNVLDRNFSTTQVMEELSKITTKPIRYVYDVITSEYTQQLAVDILAEGGRLALPTPLVTASSTKGIEIGKVFANARSPFNIKLFMDLYPDKVYQWVETGDILPNRYEALPGGLSAVAGGLARLEAGQISRLKLIVHPQEV